VELSTNSTFWDELSENEKKELSSKVKDFGTFSGMTHVQIFNMIKEGLHKLTTVELVTLHSEISKVQIESSHLREDIKEKA